MCSSPDDIGHTRPLLICLRFHAFMNGYSLDALPDDFVPMEAS
jgi:hypothetical protein